MNILNWRGTLAFLFMALMSITLVNCSPSNDSKPKKSTEFTEEVSGFWLMEGTPLSSLDINAIFIDKKRFVYSVSRDLKKDNLHIGYLFPTGVLALNDKGITFFSPYLNRGNVEIVEFLLSRKSHKKKIAHLKLKKVMTNEKQLRTYSLEKYEAIKLTKSSKEEIETAAKNLLKSKSPDPVLKEALLGTKWKLIRKIVRAQEADLNYEEKSIKAADLLDYEVVVNDLTEAEIKIYQLKHLNFSDLNLLIINVDQIQSKYILSDRTLVTSRISTDDNERFMERIGVVEMIEDSMTITKNYDVKEEIEENGVSKTVSTPITEILSYTRVK